MAEPATIADGKVVTLRFVLRDDEGDLIDESEPDRPLVYLHGAEEIVPGLEAALVGKAVGVTLSVVVPPEEGYGHRFGPGPQELPRDAFPEGVEVEIGMPFTVENEEGEEMDLFVADMEGDQVWVDICHPLAGETLHFEVEVLSVRDATAEEMEHGHAHSADGHVH
jgi:FKBP-type peptidyl-prolyl cis-trans isomerase SlyD